MIQVEDTNPDGYDQKQYQDWDKFDSLIQVGIEPMSKYELLCLVKKIYERPTTVIPTSTKKSINRCLVSDFYVPDIESQLLELKTIL